MAPHVMYWCLGEKEGFHTKYLCSLDGNVWKSTVVFSVQQHSPQSSLDISSTVVLWQDLAAKRLKTSEQSFRCMKYYVCVAQIPTIEWKNVIIKTSYSVGQWFSTFASCIPPIILSPYQKQSFSFSKNSSFTIMNRFNIVLISDGSS
jgi:hypothetical protein